LSITDPAGGKRGKESVEMVKSSPQRRKKLFIIDSTGWRQNNWSVIFDWWLFYIYLAGAISAERRWEPNAVSRPQHMQKSSSA
jgi:hypothetical protein